MLQLNMCYCRVRNDKGDQIRGENMKELFMLWVPILYSGASVDYLHTLGMVPNNNIWRLLTDTETQMAMCKSYLRNCWNTVRCCTNGGDKILDQPPDMRCIPRA
ncbi:hypothetical protein RHGRI_033757 [Rhododendron griersonianum]|uniref:Uncharacterized protein n=1 Tax=Rhododendron griersonianum TaxID=479676 RepID=A0AAV6HY08_9ERIC|nr:hypothetical protein RHGRI_033757 [Rhododendron griersonianum]